MDIHYLLAHVEISMIITAAIGIFGMIVEPGPVPQLMVATGLGFSALYGIFYGLWYCINNRIRVRRMASRKRITLPRCSPRTMNLLAQGIINANPRDAEILTAYACAFEDYDFSSPKKDLTDWESILMEEE